jgi:N-acetylglucosamine kinase-like BadF-type ATPase
MYYLGITNIKDNVEFILIDDEGKIFGWHKEHAVELLIEGPSIMKGMFESGIARLSIKSGINIDDIDFCMISVPGYGEDEDFDQMMNQVAEEIFPKGNFLCESDLETSLTAAFGLGYGIVLMMGAGSVALGRNRKHEIAQSGGWGFMAGDEAGEYWLFRNAIEIFIKQADQRSQSNIFYTHLKEQLDFDNDYSIMSLTIEDLRDKSVDFDQLISSIFNKDILLDPDIKILIDQTIDELILMIQGVLRQLDFNTPIKLSLIGRLFHEKYPLQELLMKKIEAYQLPIKLFTPLFNLSTATALHGLIFRKNISIQIIKTLIEEEQRLLL